MIRKLGERNENWLRRVLGVLGAISLGAILGGCGPSGEGGIHSQSRPDKIPAQVRAYRAKQAPRPYTAQAASSQPQLAPFFGNLTAVSVPSSNNVALQRQADCSLTLSNFLYTDSTTSMSVTINSESPHYEQIIHQNAFLTTTPGQFTGGCEDSLLGTTSRPVTYIGKTTGGLEVGATAGSTGVYASAMKADGSFTTPQALTTPYQPQTMTGADLNGDGNPDMVAVSSNALQSTLSVYLGKSDGTFLAGTNYTLPAGYAVYAVIDDLNGDGKLDVLVGSYSVSYTFSIFLGNGDGTLQAPQSFSPTSVWLTESSAFLTTDVNGDGKRDIVTSTGEMYLGTGNGTTFNLAAQTAFPRVGTATNFFAPSLVTGDFNKDGKVDLATNDGAEIRIFLGHGNATFTPGPAYATIPNRSYLIATDVDGDGNIDLVSGLGGKDLYGGDDYLPNICYVLMGNGDGTFQGAQAYPGQYTGSNLADLDDDGIPDLVTYTSGGTALVFTTLLGTGTGGFTSGPQLTAPPYIFNGTTSYPISSVDSYVVADFDGDGTPDLLYAANPAEMPVAGYFLAIGNGDGSFKTPNFLEAPTFLGPGDIDVNPALTGIMSGDFNHDGKRDVIYSFSDYSYNLHIYTQGFAVQLGNGDGTFQAAKVTTTYSNATTPPVAFSGMLSGIWDVNSDGFPDVFLILPTTIVDGTLQRTVKLYLNDGTGGFSSSSTVALTGNIVAPSLTSNWPNPISFADLNGDGKVDLIAGGSSSDGTTPELAIALGNGDGTFQAPSILKFQGFGYVGTPAIGDFDGDGKDDVFVAGSLSESGVLPGNGDGTLQTISNGDGTVTPPQVVPLQLSGNTIAIDLTADDKLDLIVGNAVLLNKAGSITPPVQAATTTTVSASASSIAVGDPVTFTATVTGAEGSTGVPTGTVTFFDGETSIGTGTLGNDGTAMLSNSTLTVGTHNVIATYGGDTNFYGSSSPSIAVTVTPASSGDFSLGLNPGSGSVNAGDTATSTLTLTPSGGYITATSFSCSGLPAYTSCNFNPSTLTPAGSAVSTTVKIITTKSSAMVPGFRRPWHLAPPLFAPWAAAMLGLLLVFLLASQRYRKIPARIALPALLLLVGVTVLGMTGCGSASAGGGGSGNTTPSGTYTVTVTATGGSVTHTATYQLTVN